jgi:transposase
MQLMPALCAGEYGHFWLVILVGSLIIRYKLIYTVTTNPRSTKRQALEATGTFNPRFAAVRHALFQPDGFFDPQDMLQLKYEALRALEKDGYPIAQAASEFGLSRPTIYQAQSQLKTEGLEGLLPRKRGPRSPHKLSAEVIAYLGELRTAEPQLSAGELTARIRQRFELKLHPRTIEKALQRQSQKKGRLKLR